MSMRRAATKGVSSERLAGAVVKKEAVTVAQENGLFVIVQSGEAVEIVAPPKGFTAKEW